MQIYIFIFDNIFNQSVIKSCLNYSETTLSVFQSRGSEQFSICKENFGKIQQDKKKKITLALSI